MISNSFSDNLSFSCNFSINISVADSSGVARNIPLSASVSRRELRNALNLSPYLDEKLILSLLYITGKFRPSCLWTPCLEVETDQERGPLWREGWDMVDAMSLDQRHLLAKAAECVSRKYSSMVVPNFRDEFISRLFPHYIIKGTCAAKWQIDEIISETKGLLDSPPNSKTHKLAYICQWMSFSMRQHKQLQQHLLHQVDAQAAGFIDVAFDIIAASQLYSDDSAFRLSWEAWSRGDYMPAVVSRVDGWDWVLLGKALAFCSDGKKHLSHGNGNMPYLVCNECLSAYEEHATACQNKLKYVPKSGTCSCDCILALPHQFEQHPRCINAININVHVVLSTIKYSEWDFLSSGWAAVRAVMSGLGIMGAPRKQHRVPILLCRGDKPSIKMIGSATAKQLSALDRLYPCSSYTDKTHMVVRLSHLLARILHPKANQDAGEELAYTGKIVPNISKSQRLKIINFVLAHAPVGTCQNVIITCLMLMFDLDPAVLAPLKELLIQGVFYCAYDIQIRVFKNFSTLLRRYGVGMRGEALGDDVITKLAYIELSFGRSTFMSDQSVELANRTTCTYHLHLPEVQDHRTKVLQWRADEKAFSARDDKFYLTLDRHVASIVAEIMPHSGTKVSYAEFLSRANDWLASGSAPGAKVAIKDPKGSDVLVDVKVGKRGWAENIDPLTFSRKIYTDAPVELATTSEKFENGKGRALYGVEPEHYLHSTYATKGLEERLHLSDGLEKGLAGKAALRMEALRSQITAIPTQHCMMLDYADFNIQHTARAQASIFKCVANEGRKRGASNDFVRANEWIAASKYNMQCIFRKQELPQHNIRDHRPLMPVADRSGSGNKGYRKRVKQGMFSGTRSTDLINTILNLAYFKVAEEFVYHCYGLQPPDLYHVHQGDDVWISTSDVTWCALMYYTLNQMGLVMQTNKQMFGCGRGEFLRVLYSEGKAGGYLGRALANFVLKEVQRPLPNNAASNIRTASSSISMMLRRGLSPYMASIMWWDQVDHWSKVSEYPGDKCPVTLPRAICRLSPFLGGLGAQFPSKKVVQDNMLVFGKAGSINSAITTLDHLPTIPEPCIPPAALPQNVPAKCTSAWLSYVSKSLGARFPLSTNSLRIASLTSNYASAIAGLWNRSIMRKYKQDMKDWVTKAGCKGDLSLSIQKRWDGMVATARSDVSNMAGYFLRDECVLEKTILGAQAHLDTPYSPGIQGLHFYTHRFFNCEALDVKYAPALKCSDSTTQGIKYTHRSIMVDIPPPSTTLSHIGSIVRGIKHTRGDAVELYHSIIVRNVLKSTAAVRSALNLNEVEAFIFNLRLSALQESKNRPAIMHWLKLLENNTEGVAALIAGEVPLTTGLLECQVQPSILQLAQAQAISNYVSNHVVAGHKQDKHTYAIVTTVPSLLIVARAVGVCNLADVKISY